jgi:hypothetical protein
MPAAVVVVVRVRAVLLVTVAVGVVAHPALVMSLGLEPLTLVAVVGVMNLVMLPMVAPVL